MTTATIPPEIVGQILEYLTLREMLDCRLASTKFKELVDTEAKLRMLELVTDASHPLVLQAGPPALFDVCEYLPLSFESFSGYDKAGYMTHAPLLATLAVSHQVDNPCHATSMGKDDTAVFQNIVLSVTRMARRLPTANSRSGMFDKWTGTAWEIARENDRIWRHWWDEAPSTPSSVYSSSSSTTTSSFPSSVGTANDSGFALSISSLTDRRFGDKPAEAARKPCKQTLEVGKTVHRATLDLSTAPDDPSQHEYRWQSVDLDVFRVILAREARFARRGVRRLVGPSSAVVLML